MGSALDVIELGTTIYEDVKDANNFPEKGTVSTAVEIGGRWTGSVLGAQKGAAVGAVIGSAFPVVGTAVGGAVGGVLGGIGGSYLGGWIGECVVDITWLYE
jgi:phage tail tape-measure protein